MSIFTATFFPVFKAVLIIFIVAIASGILLRKNIIRQVDIESMSHITITILLPCLIFSKILTSFDPATFIYWWMLPLSAFFMIGLALGISYLFYFKQAAQKKNLMAVSAFMNANYMVLPIAQMVFVEQFNEFLAYCFLFILGVSISLWSVGKYLVTSSAGEKISIKGILTPPLIANFGSIILVLTGLNRFIPDIVLKPIDFIGQAAIPVANIVLGATLASISIRKIPRITDIIKVAGTKLFFLPIIVITILYYTQWLQDYPLIADLLVLQASVAPATQLIVQVRKYGGDAQLVGSMMLVNYTLCIITIPAWLAFWRLLIS